MLRCGGADHNIQRTFYQQPVESSISILLERKLLAGAPDRSERNVKDNAMRKESRLEEESLGCLVERDGFIGIAAQVKLFTGATLLALFSIIAPF